MTADEIIAKLDLAPHPEGGHYRQTWMAGNIGRPTATCIYFLLREGEASHWHKVDAAEIWLYHAGAPIILTTAPDEVGPAAEHTLGPDLTSDQMPQVVVQPNHWQSARTTGDWTLVSCAVSPGFSFSGFTLADQAFEIPS